MKIPMTLFLILLPLAVFASELSNAVSLMQPRSFRAIINATGLEIGIFRIPPKNECIFPFANDAAWDPVSEKILFIGAPHQHPWTYGFPIYDVATNHWRAGNQQPYFDPPGQVNTHAYDNIASVYGSGKMYFYTPTPNTHPQKSAYSYCINVYDVPTDTWDIILAPNNMVSGPYSALNYFPDKNALVYTNAGVISAYDIGAGTWRMVGNRTMGGIHNVGEYDPVRHVIYVGGGLDSRQLYKIDTAWNITPIAPAPLVLDVNQVLLTHDPVTGALILWGADSLYSYDAAADRWQAFLKSPIANFQAAWAVATPVKEYGIIAFLTNYSWPLLLYKHADSPMPVVPQGKSGARSVRAVNPFLKGLRVFGHARDRFAVYNCAGRRAGIYTGSRIGFDLPAGIYYARPVDNTRPVFKFAIVR
jgi:hypothetical protein